MTEIIERTDYLTQIEKWLGKDLILVLTGQRRVGKSFTLRSLREKLNNLPNNNVIFIDKEKKDFDHISNYKDLNSEIESKFKTDSYNYILIDEVQDIAQFEKALRSWRTEEDTDIIVTGSNSHILNAELTTLIGGRFHEIYIQSLSYKEFLVFHKLLDSEESLLSYIEYGGLPGLRKIGLNSDEAHQYQMDVYHTALLKDVISKNQIRNVPFLEHLSQFIADNIGKPISSNSISKYMKSQEENVTTQAVSNYLKYLEESYLMKSVSRYDIHGKKLLETNGKFYFEDHGIRNALVGGSRLSDIEKVIENVVYQELVRNGYSVTVGQLQAGEIDFVVEKPNEGKKYVQVAYLIASPETYDREFGALKKIKDNYPKYVISMSPLTSRNIEEGIIHLHLRRFLTEGLG